MANSVSRRFSDCDFTVGIDGEDLKVSITTLKLDNYADEPEYDGRHYEQCSFELDLSETNSRKFLRSLISELQQVLTDAENESPRF